MTSTKEESIASWIWTIYKYLIQSSGPQSISHIGDVYPRPVGLPRRKTLLQMLKASDHIRVHTRVNSQPVVEPSPCIEGVRVSISPEEHMEVYVEKGAIHSFAITARNEGTDTHTLKSVHIEQNHNCFVLLPPDTPHELRPDGSHDIGMTFHPHETGVYSGIVTLTFETFSVCCFVEFICGDGSLREVLKPSSPYKKKKFSSSRSRDEVDCEGDKPNKDTSVYKSKPRPYRIPKKLKLDYDPSNLFKKEEVTEEDMEQYFQFQHNLLWAEESYVKKMLQIYDIPEGKLHLCDNRGLLSLRVQGLMEKRPSVVRGDVIHAVQERKTYSGYVYEVECENVLLKFPHSFHEKHKDSNAYEIRFTLSRSTYRILHQALDWAKQCPISWIFPKKSHIPSNANFECPDLNYFNECLNTEQQAAIKSALSPAFWKIPYVIFGPPGTGKTVTVVELVQQFVENGDKHVLICAASNSAANLLCQRLSTTLNNEKMFRLMAFGRPDVPDDVKHFCKYSEEIRGYVLPVLDDLRVFSVIVSTCTMAAKLFNMGIPDNHFDMIVLDEAGYAWEAETMACFGKQNKCRLILAGDPKQLSPTTMNPKAGKKGLEISLIQRLLSTSKLYEREDGYDRRFITKLVKCYRCHPSIIKVPNERFYDNDLIPFGDDNITHKMCAWNELPNEIFPIIFHATIGKSEREGSSPSWFNSSEIEVIVSYVKLLLAPENNVQNSDIGIIAPYQKQVSKLRTALRHEKIEDIAVGSCEQFQGQENLVIIISTVRSCHQFIETDNSLNLGFVSNAKRFNVAITRAKALLIVVGNPNVLYTDENWKHFIDECRNNNAIRGL